MVNVTQILSQIESGDPSASEKLLPLVYEELRKLAAAKMAQEQPGQTLQATALVHDAYIRLVDGEDRQWNSRGHFFAAAAEAMRRILIENARSKGRAKRGGSARRVDLDSVELVSQMAPDELLRLNEAIDKLADEDEIAARLVEIRYFAGLSTEQAGAAIGVTTSTAYRHWAYARAWLHCDLLGEPPE